MGHCIRRGEIFWKLGQPRQKPNTSTHKQTRIELWIDGKRNGVLPGRDVENEASNCQWIGVKRLKRQWDIKHVHGTCAKIWTACTISWCVLSVRSLDDNHHLQPISLCHSLRKTLKHLESHCKTCWLNASKSCCCCCYSRFSLHWQTQRKLRFDDMLSVATAWQALQAQAPGKTQRAELQKQISQAISDSWALWGAPLHILESMLESCSNKKGPTKGPLDCCHWVVPVFFLCLSVSLSRSLSLALSLCHIFLHIADLGESQNKFKDVASRWCSALLVGDNAQNGKS